MDVEDYGLSGDVLEKAIEVVERLYMIRARCPVCGGLYRYHRQYPPRMCWDCQRLAKQNDGL